MEAEALLLHQTLEHYPGLTGVFAQRRRRVRM